MNPSSLQLDPIDLSIDSRSTLAELIQLLTPHVPYSLPILGSILSADPRSGALQDIDLKVSLWSTVPIRSRRSFKSISATTDHHDGLFSMITFSHLNHQFYFFCSGESRGNGHSDLPTTVCEAEEMHVKQVFERLLDIASEAHPAYTSVLSFDKVPTRRSDADPPEILITAVHARWAPALASLSRIQISSVRYVCPPSHGRKSPPLNGSLSNFTSTDDTSSLNPAPEVELEMSEIRESDLAFVRASTSVPRSDAYNLSRAPYSVCIRESTQSSGSGRPIACVFMHCDGSIGSLHVDPGYRRQGLGLQVIRALMEKMQFSREQSNAKLSPSNGQDSSGGALGWNWMDTDTHNVAANQFFTSLVGKENMWMTHWTYMRVHPM